MKAKIGAAVGALLILLCLGIAICYFCLRRRKASTQNNTLDKVEAKAADAKSGGEDKSTTPAIPAILNIFLNLLILNS